MTSRFLRKFRSGQPVIGTMVMYVRTPGIVRMAAAAGLDYVLIDQQHSNLGFETIADMCEMARACDIAALVRPSVVSPDTINRMQDLGVDGFMFHDVTSRVEIETTVGITNYPPAGIRGIALGGPGSNYRPGAIDADFLGACNDDQFRVVQIESRDGLERLDEIVATGGVDVVDIGRQDLSISLGVPGQLAHPDVVAAVAKVVAACEEHGVAFALAAGTEKEAGDVIASGARMVTWRTDKSILLDSYRNFAAAAAESVDASLT